MDNRPTSHDRVLAQRHAEGWMFLIEAAREMRTTGALAPRGTAPARALTEPVRAQAGRPVDILEAGTGTGAVTRALIAQLSPGSRLDIAETNPRSAARIRHLAATHPRLAGHREQVRVHPRRVEDLDTDRRYDVIVSGLHFADFTHRQVETVMDRYLELLHPGGTPTYSACLGTWQLRALLPSRTQARRRRSVDEVPAAYQRRYATGCRTAWAHLPPARVRQLKRPADAVPGPAPAVAGAGR
ncbi:translation initiation factor IF-2 [Streptomyces sp. NRRL F-5755]|uniref:methyltransferase n=1 Tax=Streptomyces sp. NRRL F-5755 TaxID=1519475 RepID=UPI0006AEB7C9|nr:methyltransferase [Streptomyces sp. NRRL F-5755]KOT93220.1 translation initiation factor IF-2 [Streptomyces sp. NRRL F-5755]